MANVIAIVMTNTLVIVNTLFTTNTLAIVMSNTIMIKV